MLDRSEVGKRGYLDRDFRLVHLKDSLAQKIDYHYHEFDKLVIFLGGKVTYVVDPSKESLSSRTNTKIFQMKKNAD